MVRITLFGDSYITRLERYCKGQLRIPGDVQFLGKGGLKTSRMDNSLFRKVLTSESDAVFLNIGSNDINPDSPPRDIYNRITDIVNQLRDSGVSFVFIGELLTRNDFTKCPGLDFDTYEKQRKKINALLAKQYKNSFIRFPDIKYPKDYLEDDVHLQTFSETSNNTGMKKYESRIRGVLCSVKKQY